VGEKNLFNCAVELVQPDARKDVRAQNLEGAGYQVSRAPQALDLVPATKDYHLLPAYILKTPKVVSSGGAFAAAERPRARTMRVSIGSMTPSSQSLAVEW
jgi:hypothetical protein